jgi:hypothetical protein
MMPYFAPLHAASLREYDDTLCVMAAQDGEKRKAKLAGELDFEFHAQGFGVSTQG